MKSSGYTRLLLLFFATSFTNKMYAQIDCSSASGITALMFAPVIITPTDVDDFGGISLKTRGTTKLFLNPPSTISSACGNAILMYVFFSTSQSELNGLPALAAQNLTTLFAKPHANATITATANPNIKDCVATIDREGLAYGGTIYYRWAKQVKDPTKIDPIVWSSTLSFVVTTPPVANLKFDVDLELHHVVVKIVKDLDGTEDLEGPVQYWSLKALNKDNDTKHAYWPTASTTVSLKPGTYPINIRHTLISNLSFEELKNIELKVGGHLFDHEDLGFPPKLFSCTECDGYNIRKLKFIQITTTQTSILNLLDNGNYQSLKFADDNYFELNYYESGKKNDGWIKFMFKVLVKPHD